MTLNRSVRLAAMVGLLLCTLLSGCNGPQAAEVTQWGQAVTAARQQSDTVFAATNTLVREGQIAYAATQPNLNSKDFQPGLTDASLQAWRASLDALSSYSNNVAKLADPTTYAGTGASAAALGQEIAAQAKLSTFKDYPGLAGAITKIGDAVASAAGRQAAQGIMRDANPGVQDLLTNMEYMLAHPSVIDPTVEQGVIAEVNSNWGTRLASIQLAFLKPGADKQAIAKQYADELGRRENSIGTLRSLRSSLETLARNHGELAAGHPTDTAAVIAQLKDSTKLAQDILDELKKKP
jgi:hypothetical protein